MAKEKSPYIIGRTYALTGCEMDGTRGRLTEITFDGYYVFKITTKGSDIEELMTKVPEENVIIKG